MKNEPISRRCAIRRNGGRESSRIVALVMTALIVVASPVPAATVRALTLPAGFTVAVEDERRAVVLGPDDTVAALAEPIDAGYHFRAIRWTADGSRAINAPLPVFPAQNGDPARVEVQALAGSASAFYVTGASFFSGAFSGQSTNVQRWTRTGTLPVRIPACVNTGQAEDAHAYGADSADDIALTVDMTASGSFMVMHDDTEPGAYAPYAFILNGTRCRSLGRAVVTSVRGRWAAGYRGYLDGHLAPTNLNVLDQHIVAVRWNGTHLSELGDGDAFAVSSGGIAVGASAIPGRFHEVQDGAVPHAKAWDRHGVPFAIERDAERSVAYDIADDGTVVGTLRERNGRHAAFRWRQGRLERLDDLPHPAGWRFESAYAIGTTGAIAGIGTLHGIATVFVWRDDRR